MMRRIQFRSSFRIHYRGQCLWNEVVHYKTFLTISLHGKYLAKTKKIFM